jgi:hypothetical protein
MRIARAAALIVLTCDCGGGSSGHPSADGAATGPTLPGDINGRTIQDLCATLCAHAKEQGCETDWLYLCDVSANNCLDLFVSQPECHTAYLKDNACLADYSNPCDFQGMDAACLATYCSMRHICNLPDPKCP